MVLSADVQALRAAPVRQEEMDMTEITVMHAVLPAEPAAVAVAAALQVLRLVPAAVAAVKVAAAVAQDISGAVVTLAVAAVAAAKVPAHPVVAHTEATV